MACAPERLAGILRGPAKSPVKLPLESRNAHRVAERLQPAQGEGFYVWLVSRRGSCYACIVYGGSYRVDMGRGPVRDPLSGLTISLPEPSGWVDGHLVWRARWRGGLLRVDDINCHAVAWPDGTVSCGPIACQGVECLEACRAATLGP